MLQIFLFKICHNLNKLQWYINVSCRVNTRGATEQSTLTEPGKFPENLIPILGVDYSCAYNNLLKRLRFLGNKQ